MMVFRFNFPKIFFRASSSDSVNSNKLRDGNGFSIYVSPMFFFIKCIYAASISNLYITISTLINYFIQSKELVQSKIVLDKFFHFASEEFWFYRKV